jgi:hypothetical protein
LSFPTLGATVKENYGAPQWEEDRPKRPLGGPYWGRERMGINAHKRELSTESGDTCEVELEEVVLNGEACRHGTRACPKLVVDGVEVPLDGAGAKEESLGDLGVGEPFCH